MKKATASVRNQAEALANDSNIPVAVMEIVQRHVVPMNPSEGYSIGELIDKHMREVTGDLTTIVVAFPQPEIER